MTDLNISISARTVWQEARGQPAEGQAAVTHVLVNRVRSGRWGRTLAEVCLFENEEGTHAFSGWNARDPNRIPALRLPETDPLFVALAAMVQGAGAEPDPTFGATHYYNPSVVTTPPAWVTGVPDRNVPPATFTVQIGAHRFYKDVP